MSSRLENADAGRLFFEANPQPMYVVDLETLSFLAVNDAAVEHYGYTREEFLLMDLRDIRPREDLPRLASAIANMPTGVNRTTGWRHLRKNGELLDVEIATHPMTFAGCDAALVTVIDVTGRLALERQLRDQALHDGLTGLPNQTLFEDRVQQALLRSAGRILAVLLVDLDDFKSVNDIHGRKAGDQILIDVAARLRFATREADTVARLGGHEFAILLEDSSRDLIDSTIARVREQFADPFVVRDARVHMSCTVGVADTTVAGATCDALVRCASAAAIAAKEGGEGRHQMYQPAVHGARMDRLGLANDLRGILTRDEMHLVYQPIVSLPDGAVRGAEALLRWRHPTRGTVSPVEFIPVAERSGLIVPIGTWVLRAACTEAATWPAGEHLSVSVNVSSRQLREPGFSDDVSRILGETGLDPRRLVLEVTESVLVDDLQATQLRLAQLRSLGVRVALDDFGAGYASFGYLRSLPVDVVKIDRMFVSSTSDRADRRSLILGVIRLLQSLHVQTVAEGVETADQLEYMCAMGVDRAQGFYFAYPMTSQALRELLVSASGLVSGHLSVRSQAVGTLADR